jgi:GNAT superfamily N-acetyltransferase
MRRDQDPSAPSLAQFPIRFVGPEFAEAAIGILREVSQWTAKRGLCSWSELELLGINLRHHAETGELVLGFAGDKAVACMLLQSADPVYWPRAALGTALYVHKLAVSRRSAGQRWSARMLEWAKDQARARGIRRLRLDTLAHSPLPALYGEYGFRLVDRSPIVVRGVEMVRMQCNVYAGVR